MTGNKLQGALGLARRAGKLVAGTDPVREALKKRKAALVLLAQDAAENAEKKVAPLAGQKNVPVKRVNLSREELGACVGKPMGVACVAVAGEFFSLVLASL